MGRPPISHAGSVCLASLATLATPALVFAQEAPAPAPSAVADPLSELISRLDSPDVEARTAATDRIANDRLITLRMIESHLRAGNLSLEQRQRLNAVAFRKFRDGPHAAMGIRNDPNLSGRGVTVSFLQPGFPSGQVLRLNDRIVSAAGTIIDTWERLRAVIISREPGDEIPVSVVRDGATLNLTARLGEYGRLNQSGGIEPAILEMAWDLRSSAFKPAEPLPAIVSSLTTADWLRADAAPEDIPPADYAGGDSVRTGLVVGGEPRGGKQPRPTNMGLTRNFNNRAPGGPFIIQRPGAEAVQLQLQLQIQQFERFRQQRESLATQLDKNIRLLADSSTPESTRVKLNSENSSLRDGIRILDIQMQTTQTTIKQLQQR